ncbi:YSIRK-type signal peptide-containing protein [Tuanshanicoccus lijuaniae]|uniref:YSIRK-type signal peptide-containing protein n=1 Tax=Aerococcaceae bacterium zg-1292 TaxID=2774330 RepID=UPI001BD85470|nr:YSIRK-type signal peptide-containing protein [Aerococcaceae bacterium zg-A91]MBS4458902.1 YSIRK-type signal peptide-containing protein [Aerococcaceae bacterium zg-BR33]
MLMFYNKKQRFSLRKYKIGVCSVLLGTTFIMSANQVSAEETVPSEPVSSSAESVEDPTLEAEPTPESKPVEVTDPNSAEPSIDEAPIVESPEPKAVDTTTTQVETVPEPAKTKQDSTIASEPTENALTTGTPEKEVEATQEGAPLALAATENAAQQDGHQVTPAADEVLDEKGWKDLKRFSNKPGVFYVQKSGIVNNPDEADKNTEIYEVDTKTGEITKVTEDKVEGGGTLYDDLLALAEKQGFGGMHGLGIAKTGKAYKAFNALGLSNDGRYAYTLGYTSDNDVVDRTTINGIYRYDMQTKTWSLVSDSSKWADGMGVMNPSLSPKIHRKHYQR